MRRSYPGVTQHGDRLIRDVRSRSHPLFGPDDLTPLLQRIGDARIVMLGEASHGTHEYYTWRSYISQRLIAEKGFRFIAVEGDWPDCYEVNCYIKQYSNSPHAAVDVLKGFDRWPTWMWGNWEIAAFAEWLKKHNAALDGDDKVGFYGLDVYSLWESMEAILGYLEKHDPGALETALQAYRCFEPHRKDEGQSYARSLRFVSDTCEDEVVELLKKIQDRIVARAAGEESVFSVEQNALITVNAEKYYRAMLAGGAASWNVRDTHMNETLERLLDLHGPESKAIIWEHNTHVGDARATDMRDDGMVNIGQLAREQYPGEVVLVGFGSYEGSVIAGRAWGARMQEMEMPAARKDSWEYYCHQASAENKLMIMDDFADPVFTENHVDHRAIGVVYNPEYERYGNYVPSILPMRYDAFNYIDRTRALHPLKIDPDRMQMPETYPFGV